MLAKKILQINKVNLKVKSKLELYNSSQFFYLPSLFKDFKLKNVKNILSNLYNKKHLTALF